MSSSRSSSTSYFQSRSVTKEKPVNYKVVVLGDLRTGKTSLVRRLDKGTFDDFAENEPGKEKCLYKTNIDGTPIQLEIYEPAGMNRIGSLTRNYYMCSQGVIMLYGATDLATLNQIPEWNSDTYKYLQDPIIMMLGNMTDKVVEGSADHTEVHDKAVELSQRYKFALHRSISCKTGEGIDEAFQELAQILHKTDLNESNPFKDDDAVKSSIKKIGRNTNTTSTQPQNNNKEPCSCQ